MVATPSTNTAQNTEVSAAIASNLGAGFMQTLRGFGEKIFEAGRATVEFLREGLLSNSENVSRIPDAFKTGADGFTRNLIDSKYAATAKTAATLALLPTLVGLAARPADAQIYVSNLPGQGANIDVGQLADSSGSLKLLTGGGLIFSSLLPQRSAGFVDAAGVFNLSAGTKYRVIYSAFTLAVDRTTSKFSYLSSTNVEFLNFSIAKRDQFGQLQATADTEFAIPSSALRLSTSGALVEGVEGFSNTRQFFQQFTGEFDLTPTVDISGDAIGANFSVSENGTTSLRTYGLNFTGSNGTVFTRIGTGSMGTQTDVNNAFGAGITIREAGSAVAAPEPGTAAYLLLITGLAALKYVGSKVAKGRAENN